MIEVGKIYRVVLTNETSFFGVYEGNVEGLYSFLTHDKNSEVNQFGCRYVTVPARYYVNPSQIVLVKEYYSKEEQNEYWTKAENNYNFEDEAAKIFLTEEQKKYFEGVVYNTKKECEKELNK